MYGGSGDRTRATFVINSDAAHCARLLHHNELILKNLTNKKN